MTQGGGSNVAELRAAVAVIIHETNDVEENVGSQIERIDEITQLLAVVSEGNSQKLEEMSLILQECRQNLNEVVAKLNSVSDKGLEYNAAL